MRKFKLFAMTGLLFAISVCAVQSVGARETKKDVIVKVDNPVYEVSQVAEFIPVIAFTSVGIPFSKPGLISNGLQKKNTAMTGMEGGIFRRWRYFKIVNETGKKVNSLYQISLPPAWA